MALRATEVSFGIGFESFVAPWPFGWPGWPPLGGSCGLLLVDSLF